MSGIFGLNYVYKKQLENSSNDYSKSGWNENSTYGYSEMDVPSSVTNADYQKGRYLRQDLSTGVLSLTGAIFPNTVNYENGRHSVLASKFHGYSVGGSQPSSYTSDVRKFEFSTETGFNVSSYPTHPSGFATGFDIQSEENGYILGGATSSSDPDQTSIIRRLDFSTDQYTDFTSSYLDKRNGGDFESQRYGYLLGGNTGPSSASVPNYYTNSIEKLDFSNENLTTIGDTLNQKTTFTSGLNSNLYGYYAGGQYAASSPPPDTSYSSYISKIDFDTDTNFDTSARTAVAAEGLTNMNGSVDGYFLGGAQGATIYSQIVRLDFLTDTATTESGSYYSGTGTDSSANSNADETNPARYDRLITRAYRKGVSNKGRFFRPNGYSSTGYICGGLNYAFGSPDVYYSTVEKISFSDDTSSLMDNNLPDEHNRGQVASSNNYGYIISGEVGNSYTGSTNATSVKRVDFVTDVPVVNSNGIPFPRKDGGSVSDTENAYLSGGVPPFYDGDSFANVPSRRLIGKLNFTTDTTSDTSMSIRNTNYTGSAGVSDGKYGYFVGGILPTSPYADYSTVSRIDFSSETLSGLSNLPENISGSGVVQNKLYGFFMANEAGPVGNAELYNPNTYKLDFATGSMSDTGVLTFPDNDQLLAPGGAVSGDYYGYIAGELYAPQTLYKFDYITFTKENIPNVLNTGRRYCPGFKNSAISTI